MTLPATRKPFIVMIYPLRGIKPTWRVFAECDTRLQAEDVVDFNKEIDKRFPVGHYLYQIHPNPNAMIGVVHGDGDCI